ncbi:MAG: phage shock protein PspA [Opitutales bacterium]|nr:phage shock protein PspA [Opitutales bacterium]
MGIFTRFRDIIQSNLNAMLDKAEDPEKLIRLMIQEMEDTLVELKASCAGAMAGKARVLRAWDAARERSRKWEAKAQLAVEKGRDDLAREALLERRHADQEAQAREEEMQHFEELIGQYQDDIGQLEDKLEGARNKHRILVQRHIHASRKKTAETRIRKAETSDAFVRFDQFESRIDRMEAEADLVRPGRRESLDEAFEKLETDDSIEAELAALRKRMASDKDAGKAT